MFYVDQGPFRHSDMCLGCVLRLRYWFGLLLDVSDVFVVCFAFAVLFCIGF